MPNIRHAVTLDNVTLKVLTHFNWIFVSVKVSYHQLAAMVVNCKINFGVLESQLSSFQCHYR